MIAYHKENGIWVVPVSGGEPREIAKGGWCYTWSPDGKELAFMDSIGATCISIMALATGEMRQINIPNAWWNLIWSPDGSKLAFLSYTKEKGPQIWVVPATGGEPPELASDDPGDKFFLYWSPDGRKLSYNSSRYVKVGMGAIWGADVGELLSGAEREQ